MRRIDFTKMVAAGNDFAVVDNTAGNYMLSQAAWSGLAKGICGRKYGAGADGLLVLEAADGADIRMRIFNPDGSEVQMCGNGARCCARYFDHKISAIPQAPIRIETKAGMIEALVNGDVVRLKMSPPHGISLNKKIRLNNSDFTVHGITSGVPHAVVFVKDLEDTDVLKLGGQIRYHKEFAPSGTNADFVKVLGRDDIAVRTYERGVEDETLACGTGCVASAVIYALEKDAGKTSRKESSSVRVLTRSGEALEVSFDKNGREFKNVFLEGSARIVYEGSFVPRDRL